MRYRRATTSGACWFFTVNLADRQQDLLVRHIDLLREVIRHVKQQHPFEILAMVVMPDHLHAIWQLPPGDSDYPMRWSLIKAGFSRGIAKTERIRESRVALLHNSKAGQQSLRRRFRSVDLLSYRHT